MADLKHLDTDKATGRQTVLIKDITPGYANALRRAITEDVPTMAIHDVEIVQNNSALYDEMLAHRLGLVPLETDLKGYTPVDECTCEGAGCAKCTVQMTLKVSGPKIVTAGDLKTKDPKIKPVHEDTPIVQLLEGQEVELIATAMLGKGKEHVKWSPGMVWYEPDVKVEVKKDKKKLEECKSKLPPQIFDKDDKIDTEKITGKLVDAVEGVCPELITIERSKTDFRISIEPWGQIGVKEMVTEGLDRLNKLFTEFDEKLEEAE